MKNLECLNHLLSDQTSCSGHEKWTKKYKKQIYNEKIPSRVSIAFDICCCLDLSTSFILNVWLTDFLASITLISTLPSWIVLPDSNGAGEDEDEEDDESALEPEVLNGPSPGWDFLLGLWFVLSISTKSFPTNWNFGATTANLSISSYSLMKPDETELPLEASSGA